MKYPTPTARIEAARRRMDLDRAAMAALMQTEASTYHRRVKYRSFTDVEAVGVESLEAQSPQTAVGSPEWIKRHDMGIEFSHWASGLSEPSEERKQELVTWADMEFFRLPWYWAQECGALRREIAALKEQLDVADGARPAAPRPAAATPIAEAVQRDALQRIVAYQDGMAPGEGLDGAAARQMIKIARRALNSTAVG